MKVQFSETEQPDDGFDVNPRWHPIKAPGYRLSFLLAGLAGLATPLLLLAWLITLSFLRIGYAASSSNSLPWSSVVLALILFIPLHELLHTVAYPKLGRSEETRLVIWPRKLRIGVYFNGCLSRRRWLAMRLAPLLGLSFLPLALLTIFRFVTVPYSLLIFLQVTMIVNSVGSGGDLVAVILVLKQVPKGARICFKGGRAYWHHGLTSF